MKQEQTISWLAIITFTEPNNADFCQAYANGNTLAELKVDAMKVYIGLKETGRTPTKFVVSKKVVTTWIEDEQSFTELLK